MAGNNKKNGYKGTLPFYNRCKLHHKGQCTAKCRNCKRIRHLARDFRTVVTVPTQGTPGPNQGVITCFECGAQGHYRKDYPKVKNQNPGNKARVPDARGKAYVLGGGDANPGSNTVTGTFLLNDHHAYMLFDSGADRSFVSNTFSTLLDIIPSALDLAKNHAVIVCDEKIVRIPYGNEILIVQGDKSDKEKKSTLSDLYHVKRPQKVYGERFSTISGAGDGDGKQSKSKVSGTRRRAAVTAFQKSFLKTYLDYHQYDKLNSKST
ncbi:hypothetical protein Tco_0717040 [Tanacetum coccineum]